MKKRIVSLLLALVIVLGMIPSISAASHPFTDVSSNAWYAKYVQYVYENGLMSGTAATKFEPNSTMTRAMTVTVLYRLAGSPDNSGKNPFSDIAADKWYTNPVLWASENSITSGTSATKFSPNANVTREQLVTFLYRYAETMGKELESTSISKYSDYSSISQYARTPFAWAVAAGIISGTDASHLSPKQSATRAQCATILTRFQQWVNGEEVEETTPTEPAPTDPSTPVDPDECEHEYEPTETVGPTLENMGYTRYTCKYCGESYKSDYVDRCATIEEEREVAALIVEFINQYRVEEGAGACEVLPKMTLVAEYRANQLTANYAHDTYDTREAHAYYEYGEYIDATKFGDPAELSYWTSHTQEAIGKAYSSSTDLNHIAEMIAQSYRDSESHWAYVSDDLYKYMAIGVKYDDGTWFTCIMVGETNYG